MDWGKIVGTISAAAPTLGSLFGPGGIAIGALAGTGLKLVATALGVQPTQEAITTAIATDPEAVAKLAKYEMDYKIEIQKLQIQSEQILLADVQNARQREVEISKATGKKDLNLFILAWVMVIGFFILMGCLLSFSWGGKPIADTTGVLFMLFGSLSSAFGAVIQYFFGSSIGSAEKTELLAKASPIK